MGKKLEGNGLWESSRMMLPEHREAILMQKQEMKRSEKPILDEQAFEEIARLIQESNQTGRIIKIMVFDPFETITVTGCVQIIDPHLQRIRFFHDYKKTWIPFCDIIGVK